MRGVTGRADAFKAGARVMKNVTGYDLPKLLTGSYGTLAALTAITIKVLPKPETEETLVIAGLDDAAAVRAMSLALQSPCEVSGAAHLPGAAPMTFLRLEGITPSVAYRRDKLAALLKEFSAAGTLPAKQSKKQWQAIRDVAPLASRAERCLWRISVAPTEGPLVAQKVAASVDARWFYDLGGGLVWLDVPSTDDAAAAIVRGAVGQGPCHADPRPRSGAARRSSVPAAGGGPGRPHAARQTGLRPGPNPQSRPHVSGGVMATKVGSSLHILFLSPWGRGRGPTRQRWEGEGE